MEVVLQWSPSQEEPVGGPELSNYLRQFRLLVLDAVGLVDDKVAPVEFLEGGLLPEHHLIRGDDHIPLPRHYLFTDYPFLEGYAPINITPSHIHHHTLHTHPLLSAPNEADGDERWTPAFELSHPITES